MPAPTPGSPTVEYARAADGTLARRTPLGGSGLALVAERFVPGMAAWWLHAAALDEARFPAISEEDARAIAGAHLSRPCADRQASPATTHAASPRHRWLDDAVATSWAWIDGESTEVRAALPWASPGTREYDAEIDRIRAVKAAYRTLEALCDERRGLARPHRRG